VTTYASDTIGTQDPVLLVLGGDELMVSESWNVHEGVLEQPMAWTIQCGWGGTAKDFLSRYTKGTPFQLYVAGALQTTGRLDGRRAANPGGGTTVMLKGRDMLARVYDSHVDAVQTFQDSTYVNLVWRVLLYLNLVTGQNPDPAQLATTNEANRQIKAGKTKTIVQLAPPRTVDEILTDAEGVPVTPGVHQQIQANIGESWLSFLRRYLDPAGLILWAAADGTFVLSSPNTAQQPLYQITRQDMTNTTQPGNVTGYEFDDDATHRHSVCVCYGRGGGRKTGRTKGKGGVVDDDLFNEPSGWYRPQASGGLANGYAQPLAIREANCQNTEQAENFAQRKLAEERRRGWVLSYTVAGQVLPVYGSTGGLAVITPDTIVSVNDEELGLQDNYYLESLERSRHPYTSTKIRLCRTTDILLDPTTT
jgi:prophage tail gpP-like protein